MVYFSDEKFRFDINDQQVERKLSLLMFVAIRDVALKQ